VADNLPFVNVNLDGLNGADICDQIKSLSLGTLATFFINPTTLWCGLLYTPYVKNTDPFALGSVNYRLGYNVIKDNSLKERTTEGEPVKIEIKTVDSEGNRITINSNTNFTGRIDKHFTQRISDQPTLLKIANEKQYLSNYAGYEGAINSFLQPICAPGWKANILDDRYPERNGVYMIDGTEIIFGQRGGKIKVEIGPKIGFNPNITTS